MNSNIVGNYNILSSANEPSPFPFKHLIDYISVWTKIRSNFLKELENFITVNCPHHL